MEPKKIKPKLKVLNVDEDEMKLKDEDLIDRYRLRSRIILMGMKEDFT